MTNRLDLGEFSIPLDFASIEIGDYVRSAEFPWLHGRVLRTGMVSSVPSVSITGPFGLQATLVTGDIVPLGYANAEAI